MGFRSLTKFLDSLLARSLEAKYYNDTNFMKTILQKYPFYTQKSIQAAMGVLHVGMSQQVGIGETISIWNDARLPEPTDKKIHHTTRNSEINKVVDLIDKKTILWKEDFITSVLTPKEATRILCIPLL